MFNILVKMYFESALQCSSLSKINKKTSVSSCLTNINYLKLDNQELGRDPTSHPTSSCISLNTFHIILSIRYLFSITSFVKHQVHSISLLDCFVDRLIHKVEKYSIWNTLVPFSFPSFLHSYHMLSKGLLWNSAYLQNFFFHSFLFLSAGKISNPLVKKQKKKKGD